MTNRFLLPALKDLPKTHKYTEEEVAELDPVYTAVIRLLLDSDSKTKIPVQLYHLGHALKDIRKCAITLSDNETNTATFK